MKSRRIRVLVVFGTRPEAIKLVPVVNELSRHRMTFDVSVCVTAQHRKMLDQVISLNRLRVDYDLNVMTRNQALPDLTARLLVRISRVVREALPDLVLVQGDTTTALTASLAAFYHRVPIAHIEAGLRTKDRLSPFPEEINRRLITHLADYHFAPTEWARDNLMGEGIPPGRIFVTGNTVVDAFLEARRSLVGNPPVIPELRGLDLRGRKIILVTAHRRESFGSTLEGICRALREIAISSEEVEIIYPVHPNPNVRVPVQRLIGRVPRIHLTRPLDYLSFVWLMGKAYLALTDSGGIQEEMPSVGRPVLVMREKTERPEGLKAGVCQLVGTRTRDIVNGVLHLLRDKHAYRQFSVRPNPFGDGKASERIVRHLARLLGRP